MKTRLIEITVVLVVLFLLALAVGCKEKVEAAVKIGSVDAETSWMFEGTFCLECNYLYNHIEHPKICDKCGEETKDFYYLCLIKDRK